MPSPHKVFAEAAATLDGADPGRLGIYADVTGQPVGDSGYVYAQVGWLDEEGTAYGLRLPDSLYQDPIKLRPLYICLGRHVSSPDQETP
jgi:hypothetical protein